MMASLGAISSSHSPLMKNSKVFLIAMYLFSPQDFPLISPYVPVFCPSFGFSKALYSTSSPSTRTALDYALGKLICTMIPAFFVWNIKLPSHFLWWSTSHEDFVLHWFIIDNWSSVDKTWES